MGIQWGRKVESETGAALYDETNSQLQVFVMCTTEPRDTLATKSSDPLPRANPSRSGPSSAEVG